ncbi:cold-inducible protein YdjO-related protein [Alicyclobacillus sp. SO9]|uniref:cold-inducible protein YdjO-related protein n=1 Tax=Alicyclobacillus sp. SO9 TaxID=2665646 RepID=UPI0018E8551C|nr:cold-inducible protein YdjO-related protein [Alicyclobacillus sp. SO9]QQE78231.1 hypothetical protein GI364_20470 [Alicyclobacillus sp. SO9]
MCLVSFEALSASTYSRHRGGILVSYFNNRRKPSSEYVYADTVIWQCSRCNCWSRKEFIYVDDPSCPMCKSKMNQEAKLIRVD